MNKFTLLSGIAALSLITGSQAFAGNNNDNNNQGPPAATFSVSTDVQGNDGTANTTETNTFSLTGNVTPDCSFYTGDASKTVALGTIGVKTNPNVGLADAFDMVDSMHVDLDTSVAGCNTKNTVTISKSNAAGLINSSTGGYDNVQFTNTLPYELKAAWTGVALNSTAAGSAQSLTLAATSASSSAQLSQGAWKSAMAIDVNVPAPSKSLLAGAYTGSVTVELKVL